MWWPGGENWEYENVNWENKKTLQASLGLPCCWKDRDMCRQKDLMGVLLFTYNAKSSSVVVVLFWFCMFHITFWASEPCVQSFKRCINHNVSIWSFGKLSFYKAVSWINFAKKLNRVDLSYKKSWEFIEVWGTISQYCTVELRKPNNIEKCSFLQPLQNGERRFEPMWPFCLLRQEL